MWQDVQLPVCIMKFLHDIFEGPVQIRLFGGTILPDTAAYEEKSKVHISSVADYEDLLDLVDIEHMSIGDEVEVFVNATCAPFPYEDAMTYSIHIKGYEDYGALAAALAKYLSSDYRVEML